MPSANSIGHLVADLRFPQRSQADEEDEPRGDGDQLGREHEQRPHVGVDPALEEVVLPHEERQQRHADHARRGDPVAEERFSREHGQDLGHDPEAGQGHDVDLGVPEEPEEVLPQVRAPPVLVDVEGRLGGAVEDAEQARGDERRGGQRQQRGGGQDGPHEDRHPAPGHPRGSVVDDGGGEVEPRADHADPDDGEAHQIGVHRPPSPGSAAARTPSTRSGSRRGAGRSGSPGSRRRTSTARRPRRGGMPCVGTRS